MISKECTAGTAALMSCVISLSLYQCSNVFSLSLYLTTVSESTKQKYCPVTFSANVTQVLLALIKTVFEELFENQNISDQEIVNLFYTNNEENGNDQNEGRSRQTSPENSTTTGDNPTGSIETDRGNDTGEERQDAEVKTDLSLKQKKQLVISRYGGMYEDVANATPEEIYNTIPEVDYTEAKQIHAEVKAEFDTAYKPEFDYNEERYESQRNVDPEEYGHRLLSREERKNLPVWENGKMIAGHDYRIDDFEIGDTVINNYNGQALKIDRIEKNKKGEPVYFVLKDIKDGTEYRDWETDRKSTRLNASHRL